MRVLAPSLLGAALLLAGPSTAQGLPQVPADLIDRASVVCVQISHNGNVLDVFMLTSAGDARIDAEILAWVRKLRWAPAVDGDVSRDRWIPMPVAFGTATAPPLPDRCAPPEAS